MYTLKVYTFDGTTNPNFDQKYKGMRCVVRYRHDTEMGMLRALITFDNEKWIRTSPSIKAPKKENGRLILKTLHSEYEFTDTGMENSYDFLEINEWM